MKRFLVRLTSFPGTRGVVASSEVTLATELVRDRAGFMAGPGRETVGVAVWEKVEDAADVSV